MTQTVTVCNFDSPSISPADPGIGGRGSSNDATVPWDRICEGSFDYQTVGESYTASLRDVSQKYVHLPMNILDFDFVGFKSDMCISVPRRNRYGQFMSINDAKELTVRAYEKARGQVMDGVVRDIINTPTDASRKFKEYFNQKLKDEYFWNPWAIRANLSRCRGLPARIPSYGC